MLACSMRLGYKRNRTVAQVIQAGASQRPWKDSTPMAAVDQWGVVEKAWNLELHGLEYVP